MSAAWMVLNSSSATPAPSTLMGWGWKRASGAPNLSPPTLTCRPSGSYTAERNQMSKISTSLCYTVPVLVFHAVLHSGSDIMYSRCIYTTTKYFILMLQLSNIWVDVFYMGFTETKSGRHQNLIFSNSKNDNNQTVWCLTLHAYPSSCWQCNKKMDPTAFLAKTHPLLPVYHR